MSATDGPSRPHAPEPLFAHALRLHRETPDGPLPKEGAPYPDHEAHDGRRDEPRPPRRRDQHGDTVAALLAAHFADATALPADLAGAFHDVYVPVYHSDPIAAVARATDPERVRTAGRWLVRHATDRCDVAVGLALLVETGRPEDIATVQTIGLLSNDFGGGAARALARIAPGPGPLIWLAERSQVWGRCYAVGALCEMGPQAHDWLLRRAVGHGGLDGYNAANVARATGLHQVLAGEATDPEIVDHAGELLLVMADCRGMGRTLDDWEHTHATLTDLVRHFVRLGPTAARYGSVCGLLAYLRRGLPGPGTGFTTASYDQALTAYGELAEADAWCAAAREGLRAGDRSMQWLAGPYAPGAPVPAFRGIGT